MIVDQSQITFSAKALIGNTRKISARQLLELFADKAKSYSLKLIIFYEYTIKRQTCEIKIRRTPQIYLNPGFL